MVETYLNDKGQTVYRLRKITDLALLPEHLLDEVIAQLPIFLYALRLLIAASADEGGTSGEALMAELHDYVDFADDGEHAIKLRVDGIEDPLFAVKLNKKEGDRVSDLGDRDE